MALSARDRNGCANAGGLNLEEIQNNFATRLTALAIFMCGGNVLESEYPIDDRTNHARFHQIRHFSQRLTVRAHEAPIVCTSKRRLRVAMLPKQRGALPP